MSDRKSKFFMACDAVLLRHFGRTLNEMAGLKFNDRLRALRNAKNITQAEMAERAGVSLRYYQRVEAGENEPSFGVALMCIQALGVTYEEFARAPQPNHKKDLTLADAAEILSRISNMSPTLRKIVLSLVFQDISYAADIPDNAAVPLAKLVSVAHK